MDKECDEQSEQVPKSRKWLREEVSKRIRENPTYGMLADIENLASPFYLGQDYDYDDLSDIDHEGPF